MSILSKIDINIEKLSYEKVENQLDLVLKDPTTESYPDVRLRGIKGHGYYNENYGESGFFVGIHTEGECAGQIKKAQPISAQQLEKLQNRNVID